MRWLIALVVIAILVALFFYNPEEPTSGTPPSATNTQATTQVRLSTRPPAAVPQQPRMAQGPNLARIKETARKHRVDIVRWQPTGNGAAMRLQWIGDSVGPGGDFMNDLISQGLIRNCNIPGPNEMGYFRDQQQRPTHWVEYQVTW